MAVERWARSVAVVALAVAAGLAAAVPVVLAGTGHWDSPPLRELDLGAAGADGADGTWVVEDLVAGGRPVSLGGEEPVVLDIDAVTASLVGETGCSPLLGSFTLTAGGDASFTVPSTRFEHCPPTAATIEDAVRTVLAEATSWRVDGARLVLEGGGSRLVAAPA